MNISNTKVIVQTANAVRQGIQKAGKKAAANATVVCQKASADGLSALACQKMPLVQSSNKSQNWTPEMLAKIKDKYMFFFDESEMPDDKSLNFILDKFYGAKPGDKSNFRDIGVISSKFNELTEEQKTKIFNSDVIDFLYKATDDKAFKYSCLEVPFEELDKLQSSLDDDLLRHCLEDFLNRNITTLSKDASVLISSFQEKAAKPLNSNFMQTEHHKDFYDLLMKRSYQDVVEISDILSNHQAAMQGNTGEYHSLLEKLLNATTPDGKFIFGTSGKASDTTSKTMLSGIDNILNAKETDGAMFDNLMYLLELTKQGKVPPSVLGTLAKEGKIDDEILTIIKKAQQNASLINKFDTVKAAQMSSKLGDVVSVGNEIFYRNEDGLIKLDMDEETFKQLFPPVETFAVSQGQNGDCYLVSAMVDFIKNPKTRGKIFQMFKQDGDDIIVTIPDAKEFPIRFSKKMLECDGEKNVNASLGLKMLETSYSKTRALKYGTANKLSAIAAGKQSDVYNALLGNKNTQNYYSSADLIWSPDEIMREQKDIAYEIEKLKPKIKDMKDENTVFGHIAYLNNQAQIVMLQDLEAMQRALCEELGTVHNRHAVSEDGLLKELLKLDLNSNLVSVGTKQGECFDKNKLVYGGHAYSIRNIDKENQTINLINPWNSAQNIEISFVEFKSWFDALNVAKI